MKKITTILITILVLCGLAFVVYAQSGGLVAHYDFNEGSGSSISDLEGSHNGTINGAIWSVGKEDSGLKFDGSNDYVELDSLSVSGKKLTLSAFVLFDGAISDDPMIISKAKYSSRQNWSLAFNNDSANSGGFAFNLLTDEDNYTTITQSPFTPIPNQWYHVAGTYDGNQMKLYVDGVEVSSASKAGYVISDYHPTWIGGNPSGANDAPWKGSIDEVRVYNDVLNQSEIDELAGGGVVPDPVPSEDWLIGYENAPVIEYLSTINEDYSNVVYIDPDFPEGGDGSIDSPLNSWTDAGLLTDSYIKLYNSDTAYLQKRGTSTVIDSQLKFHRTSNVLAGAYGDESLERPKIIFDKTIYGGNGAFNVEDSQDVFIGDFQIELQKNVNAGLMLRHYSTNYLVENITFYNNKVYHNSYNDAVNGAFNGLRGIGSDGYMLKNVKIIGNEIYNIREDGVYMLYVEDFEFAYNSVYDTNQRWHTYDGPGICPQVADPDYQECTGDVLQLDQKWKNVHVHHNYLDKADEGNKYVALIAEEHGQLNSGLVFEYNELIGPYVPGRGGVGLRVDGNTDTAIIRYNKFLAPHTAAIDSVSPGNLLVYGNVFEGGSYHTVWVRNNGEGKFYNNIFFNSPGGDFSMIFSENSIIEVINNIFVNEPSDDILTYYSSVDSVIVSNNLYNNQHSDDSINSLGDNNAIYQSPGFVDFENLDFHLLPNSPAIDAGMDVGLEYDMDGNTIPQGVEPDIGVYEYAGN